MRAQGGDGRLHAEDRGPGGTSLSTPGPRLPPPGPGDTNVCARPADWHAAGRGIAQGSAGGPGGSADPSAPVSGLGCPRSSVASAGTSGNAATLLVVHALAGSPGASSRGQRGREEAEGRTRRRALVHRSSEARRSEKPTSVRPIGQGHSRDQPRSTGGKRPLLHGRC